MAFGERCKYCGWQETSHIEMYAIDRDDREKILPEMSTSLLKCPGFDEQDDEDELQNAPL
jgi:hypothetical protein